MDRKAWAAARRKRTLEDSGPGGWLPPTKKIESAKRYTRKRKHKNQEDT